MNIEELKQTADAMLAFADGKPVQSRMIEGTFTDWSDNKDPGWCFGSHLYRRKPEPVSRPWNSPADVPGPVCWLRNGDSGWEWMVIMVNENWISGVRMEYQSISALPWKSIAGYEYSTDRKTWLPCTVTEAQ